MLSNLSGVGPSANVWHRGKGKLLACSEELSKRHRLLARCSRHRRSTFLPKEAQVLALGVGASLKSMPRSEEFSSRQSLVARSLKHRINSPFSLSVHQGLPKALPCACGCWYC